MFNRTRTADAKRATPGTSAIDAVLAELEAGAPAAVEAEPDTLAQPPTDTDAEVDAPEVNTVAAHTASLRATRDAQQQAQAMLTLAAQARSDATEQAEAILVEANAAAEKVKAEATAEAERLRKEAVDWTVLQRERVKAAADKVAADAEADAERHRAESMQSAMSEAEQTARRYVGEAAARGARDAEEIRGQARDLLTRASEIGADIQDSLAQIATSLEASMASVREKLRQIDDLIGETQGDERSAAAPAPDAADAAPEPRSESISAAIRAATADDDSDGSDSIDGGDELDDLDGSDGSDIDPAGSAAADAAFEQPNRRQLGALFRDLDSAGA